VSRRLGVALLFGGTSVEHEVSVVSARGVAAALDPKQFECVPIGVTGEGRWLSPEVSGRILRGDGKRVEPPGNGDDGSSIVADPGGGGLLLVAPAAPAKPLVVDVLFPVVHGWGGEDGRLQGLLDLAGIPYVGAGVAGSALGMDKEAAKRLFESRGLPVGPWRSLARNEYLADPKAAAGRLVAELGLPLFVKPACGGSSVGVTRVARREDLGSALEEAFALDRKAVVEAAIDAREVECAVLGNEAPEASVAGEILPSREFYDYAAKYLDGTSRLLIPAPLEPAVAEAVRRMAVGAFRALDLEGMARVDFFVERRTDRVFLNEVNTLPGFTPISMYPKLWEASGLSYPQLLDRLVRLALGRWETERSRVSRYEG
jgi:D-alanine-D-alanine ligase